MAATSILDRDDTADTSSDVTLETGAIATLLAVGVGAIIVEQKNSADGYNGLGTLYASQEGRNAGKLEGPITFRVRRTAGQDAGCDCDQGA